MFGSAVDGYWFVSGKEQNKDSQQGDDQHGDQPARNRAADKLLDQPPSWWKQQQDDDCQRNHLEAIAGQEHREGQ